MKHGERLRCVALIVGLSLSPFALCQAPCRNSTPYQYVNQRIVVPVFVNGHGPYPFLLDTGAQVTVIDPALAGALHLSANTAKVKIVTGVGAKASASVQQADSIQLDGHTLNNLPVVVYATANVQGTSENNVRVVGILGQNFLEHFGLVLSPKTNCVRLFDGYNPD